MSKPVIGLILGAALGLLDGISALLYPNTGPVIVPIIIGSTLKGLVTGLAAGFFARRLQSLPLGIGFGLAIGLALAFVAAWMPDAAGEHHFVAIMLPGAVLGAVVGFATQRFGRPRAQSGEAHEERVA